MGYYSSVTGRVSIVPAIPLRNMAGNSYLQRDGSVLMFEVTETREVLADGTLLRESVTAIIPSTDDSVKAYSLAEDLAEMAAEVRALGSACVGGWIVRSGEEQGDVERYCLGNGDKVVTEKAQLRWPDGSAVDA
jgi:hypothetical protein